MIHVSKNTNYVKGRAIDSINGCSEYSTLNPFNIPFGQLIYNKNMEYFNQNNSIYIKTRRGSNLIKDVDESFIGAGDYVYDLVNNYLIFVNSSGDIKYYNDTTDTIVSISSGLDTTREHNFKMIGLQSVSALYGCNRIDGVYKVSGIGFTFSLIADSPKIDDIEFSSISGRMFGINGQKIYYTEIQQLNAENLTNLETWNILTNFAMPSPDNGIGYCAVRDDGSAIYFFKDTGIICLPNAEQATTDWYFPKLKARVGTISGKTVRFVKYGNSSGFIYLATDKTLRFIAPRIEQNAGVLPSIFDDTSYVISKNFQGLLNKVTRLDLCNAVFYDNKYILNIPSGTSTNIDTTIIIDCEKLITGGEFPQPYWYFSNNLDFKYYVLRNNDNKLYGFNLSGYINELFNDDTFVDEIPSRIGSDNIIDWKIVTGWHKYSDSGEVELIKTYLKWGTDINDAIDFFANSFAIGGLVPQYDDGESIQVYPNEGSGGYESTGITNEIIASSENNEMTTAISYRAKGNYFNFSFSSNIENQRAIIYGLEPIFKTSRVSSIIKR